MNRNALVLALSAALLPAALSAKPEIGQPAPAFSALDWEGKTRSLEEFRGKTVVLEWTNHECPFVVKHYKGKNMQAQQREAAEAGVVWITINSSAPGKQGHVDAARAKAIMAEQGAAQNTYLLDPEGKLGRAYGALVTPHMYIIDGEGILRYNGAIDSIRSTDPADIPKAVQYVREGLARLSAGQSPEPALTQPYGCTIKYAD
jgi:peroxiredoxin